MTALHQETLNPRLQPFNTSESRLRVLFLGLPSSVGAHSPLDSMPQAYTFHGVAAFWIPSHQASAVAHAFQRVAPREEKIRNTGP